MNYQFLISRSGSQGYKVSRMCAGRTIRVFVSRQPDADAAQQACRNFLHNVAAHGCGANFTDAENRQMMEAAVAALRQHRAAQDEIDNAKATDASGFRAAVAAVVTSVEACDDPTVKVYAEIARVSREQDFANPRRLIFDPATSPEIMDMIHGWALDEDYHRDCFEGRGVVNYDGFSCSCGTTVEAEGAMCADCAAAADLAADLAFDAAREDRAFGRN